MAEINWNLLKTDPIGEQDKAFSYADKLQQTAARYQAGSQYAAGDYSGAAQTQAKAGDIPQAQQIQQAGQQSAARGQQYIAQALPVFTQVAQAHANDPDKGAAALGMAFDHIATEAQQVTGANPQALAAFRQSLVSDPQGTLARLQAQVPVEYKTAGDSLFQFRNGQLTNQFEGSKYIPFTAGGGIAQVGGGTGGAPAPAGGLQQPGGAASAPGGSSPGQVIPAADPNAMHAVESNNNPNAVSPVGAVGVSQTMPGTLQSPGFGVAPAKDNSAPEVQRVGDDYLQAMNARYGNAALAHIAYNMGPGNTDKWLANGGKFSQLPAETQDYLGKIAVAQAVAQQGGQGPQPQPGINILRQAQPVWHPPTPDEAKQFPGAVAMNVNGEPKYPPASQVAANMSTDQLQPFVDNLKAGGALPTSLARNPAAYAKVLQLARDQGVSMQDVLANQGTRKATQATFQQVSTRYAMVQTQEQAFQNSLALAQQKIQALGNQGGGKFLLNFKNYLKTGVSGDPATGAAINAVDTAMNEYAKIIEGSTGAGGSSVSARADAQGMLSAADNIPSFMEKIGVLKADAGYKIGALKDQYDTLSGALHSIGDAKPQPSPSDNIPTLSSPVEALKLPPGAKFKTPDGRILINKRKN